MGQVTLKLKQGHPNRSMLAQLADGEIVTIGEDGLEIDEAQITDEIRGCGWWVVDGAKAVEATKNAEDVTEQVEPEADAEETMPEEPEEEQPKKRKSSKSAKADK